MSADDHDAQGWSDDGRRDYGGRRWLPDSEPSPITERVQVTGFPRSRAFEQRWRSSSCLYRHSRVFRHGRLNVLYGEPIQLWTARCNYYKQFLRLRGLELTWPDGPRCPILVTFFICDHVKGVRAADLVLLPNLDWTRDRRTTTFRFTGETELEVKFTEQSFEFGDCKRGCRVLYVVEPGGVEHEDQGSRLLDSGSIGKPAPFYQLRFLYEVPLTACGRRRYRVSTVGLNDPLEFK